MIKGTQACKKRQNPRKRMDLVFLKYSRNRVSKMIRLFQKKFKPIKITNIKRKQQSIIRISKYLITIQINKKKVVIFKVLKKMIL
jgi:hypothetical protein